MRSEPDTARQAPLVIIPTYNNAGTLERVARGALAQGLGVLVANDGSTDGTQEILQSLQNAFPNRLHVIGWPRNKGKGHALRQGLRLAAASGYDWAVTLDADGQHDPGDIPALLSAAQHGQLVTGVRSLEAEGMPHANTWANRFSNFWFHLQTLRRIPDTQCGFRVYPLSSLRGKKNALWWLPNRYEAELLLLVTAAWKGCRIACVPVHVAYPEDRVSHFRPVRDFARIFLLNLLLCLLAPLWGYPSMAFHAARRTHNTVSA